MSDYWFADDAFFSVGFDESGGVVWTQLVPTLRVEQGPPQDLLWRPSASGAAGSRSESPR
jgi:hypothetical protein